MPSDFSAIIERVKTSTLEHERRMRDDPEYAAQQRAKEVELARIAEDEKRREHAYLVRRRRETSESPPRIWKRLDDGLDSEAAAVVARFLDGDRTFLVLAGKVGCGKTIAACSALDREGGLFVKAAAVTRAKFDDERWRLVLSARVLVVDDLGTESLDAGGWAAGALAEVFDYRYDWQRKTILTTNLDADAFKARYCDADGGRFLSRLREAGEFMAVAQDSLRGLP